MRHHWATHLKCSGGEAEGLASKSAFHWASRARMSWGVVRTDTVRPLMALDRFTKYSNQPTNFLGSGFRDARSKGEHQKHIGGCASTDAEVMRIPPLRPQRGATFQSQHSVAAWV